MSGGLPPEVDALRVPVSDCTGRAGDWRLTIKSRTASSAARDTPAMIQGVRSRPGVAAAVPAGAPQREQKRASAARAAPHAEHAGPALGRPHWGQNLPLTCDPQAGQVMTGSVMG